MSPVISTNNSILHFVCKYVQENMQSEIVIVFYGIISAVEVCSNCPLLKPNLVSLNQLIQAHQLTLNC